MGVIRKLKRAVRGEVSPAIAMLETLRRSRASLRRSNERFGLSQKIPQPARLQPQFANLSSQELLVHFQKRRNPDFFPALSRAASADLLRNTPEPEIRELIATAQRIKDEHCWPLLGLGENCFGVEIDWSRDPYSGYAWPLDYHGDIQLLRSDGSDARVVWELNRLGHLITLARAYTVTKDERLAEECFLQLQSWSAQNRVAFGVNWTCAMEVALRAMNLLGAFEVFRHSSNLNEQALRLFVDTLDQHGKYIRRNLEFSYIATSNHYLSDVVGLLWLGIMLPELNDARSWRNFGLCEMLREIDKQVLDDGADFEASTGYHRFILELLLFSFILCRSNKLEIEARYWTKLHTMLEYMRSYMRPDGLAPLIGDSDSSQVFPICRRRADDHGYALAIGACVFEDPRLKLDAVEVPEELSWVLGEQAVNAFRRMAASTELEVSKAFPHAGTYIMREKDLYLCFNASGAGLNGHGSHGHNDALSIEVSALGRPFIVGPGTYIYSADLEKRHEVRSTAYHSTVKIDGVEQNTTDVQTPFVIGEEAHPRVLLWETGVSLDKLVAEHSGYARLASPVTHRRSVIFNKTERWWLIEDQFFGDGDHKFEARFHFAPDLEVSVGESRVTARDERTGAGLVVLAFDVAGEPHLENQGSSHDYGEIQNSVSACWRISGHPGKLSWKICPINFSLSKPSE